MCITSVSKKRHMTFELYSKEPMQMVEMKLNMIIDENPHLIKTLETNVNHAFFRNYSDVQFLI